MPNKERLLQLADFIEAEGKKPRETRAHFNMGIVRKVKPCGTAACIAGFATLLWPEFAMRLGGEQIKGETNYSFNGEINYYFNCDTLPAWLEMDEQEVDLLFYPGDVRDREESAAGDYYLLDYDDISRTGAVTTIRRFAETGEIAWHAGEQV